LSEGWIKGNQKERKREEEKKKGGMGKGKRERMCEGVCVRER